MKNIGELEKKIGYSFRSKDLIERALTHSSFNREKNTRHKDNERLEFLGDAFLDAIVGAELYSRMDAVTEGTLTKTRALIVCEKALAKVSENSISANTCSWDMVRQRQEAETRIPFLQMHWKHLLEQSIWMVDTVRHRNLR